MRNNITWLRISYWAGAIADFFIAVLALIPERMGVPAYCHPMGLMSAVAFSWGCMLIWADRKPLERRWILLPTILVGIMLQAANIFSASKGVLPMKRLILNIAVGVALIALWIYSYYKSKKAEPV